MADAAAEGLVHGTVSLYLIPIATTQKTFSAAVAVVVLLLQHYLQQ